MNYIQYSWHGRHLSRPFNGGTPFDSLGSEELALRDVLAWPLWIIQHASLDDHSIWEGLSGTVDRGSTVSAEVRSDILAGISDLGDGLR
jgi:hypothetical protein